MKFKEYDGPSMGASNNTIYGVPVITSGSSISTVISGTSFLPPSPPISICSYEECYAVADKYFQGKDYCKVHYKIITKDEKYTSKDFKKLFRESLSTKKDLRKKWNNAFKRHGLLLPHLYSKKGHFSRNACLTQLKDLYALIYRTNYSHTCISFECRVEN